MEVACSGTVRGDSDGEDRFSSRPRKAKPLVLVTGASGFIGRAVIERLSAEYVRVGLDRAGPPDPPAPRLLEGGSTVGTFAGVLRGLFLIGLRPAALTPE